MANKKNKMTRSNNADTTGKSRQPERALKDSLVYERLEPRILLSADALFVIPDPHDNKAFLDSHSELYQQGDLEPQSALTEPEVLQVDASLYLEVASAINFSNGVANAAPADVDVSLERQSLERLVIVDRSVPDLAGFVSALIDETSDGQASSHVDELTTKIIASSLAEQFQSTDSNTRIFLLDADRNGIDQIGDILTHFKNVQSLHILSHGHDGGLSLGAAEFDSQQLQADAQSVSQWRTALAESADILLYGCDVANGERGVKFVTDLAKVLSVDVAASTDKTGNEALGGNWELEHQLGTIESEALNLGAFAGGLLGDINGTDGVDTETSTSGNDIFRLGKESDIHVFNNNWGKDSVIEIPGEGEADVLDFSAVTSDLRFTIQENNKIKVTTVGENNESTVTAANVEIVIGGKGENTFVIVGNADFRKGIVNLFGQNSNNTLKFEGSRQIFPKLTDADSGDITLGVGGAHILTFQNIQHIVAGSNNDQIDLSSQASVAPPVLSGGAGHDNIVANNAGGTLEGNAGSDFLTGGSGNDVLLGGDGDDVLDGGSGSGNDMLFGEDGNDTLSVRAGVDSFEGGAGNDVYQLHRDSVGTAYITDESGRLDTIRLNELKGKIELTLSDKGLVVERSASEANALTGSYIVENGGPLFIDTANIPDINMPTLAEFQGAGLAGNYDLKIPAKKLSTDADINLRAEAIKAAEFSVAPWAQHTLTTGKETDGRVFLSSDNGEVVIWENLYKSGDAFSLASKSGGKVYLADYAFGGGAANEARKIDIQIGRDGKRFTLELAASASAQTDFSDWKTALDSSISDLQSGKVTSTREYLVTLEFVSNIIKRDYIKLSNSDGLNIRIASVNGDDSAVTVNAVAAVLDLKTPTDFGAYSSEKFELELDAHYGIEKFEVVVAAKNPDDSVYANAGEWRKSINLAINKAYSAAQKVANEAELEASLSAKWLGALENGHDPELHVSLEKLSDSDRTFVVLNFAAPVSSDAAASWAVGAGAASSESREQVQLFANAGGDPIVGIERVVGLNANAYIAVTGLDWLGSKTVEAELREIAADISVPGAVLDLSQVTEAMHIEIIGEVGSLGNTVKISSVDDSETAEKDGVPLSVAKDLKLTVTNVATIIGGKHDDLFTLNDSAQLVGSLLGGGRSVVTDVNIVSKGNILQYKLGRDSINVEASLSSTPHIFGAVSVTAVVGGTGNDKLVAGRDSDATEFVSGGSGDDLLLAVGSRDAILSGGAGADVLLGDANNDILIGGSGDDILNAGVSKDGERQDKGLIVPKNISLAASGDILIGGQGQDRYRFDNNWGQATVYEDDQGAGDVIDFTQVTEAMSWVVSDHRLVAATGALTSSNGNPLNADLKGFGKSSGSFLDKEKADTFSVTGANRLDTGDIPTTSRIRGVGPNHSLDFLDRIETGTAAQTFYFGNKTGPDNSKLQNFVPGFIAKLLVYDRNLVIDTSRVHAAKNVLILDFRNVTERLNFKFIKNPSNSESVSLQITPDVYDANSPTDSRRAMIITDVDANTIIYGGRENNSFAAPSGVQFSGKVVGGEGFRTLKNIIYDLAINVTKLKEELIASGFKGELPKAIDLLNLHLPNLTIQNTVSANSTGKFVTKVTTTEAKRWSDAGFTGEVKNISGVTFGGGLNAVIGTNVGVTHKQFKAWREAQTDAHADDNLLDALKSLFGGDPAYNIIGADYFENSGNFFAKEALKRAGEGAVGSALDLLAKVLFGKTFTPGVHVMTGFSGPDNYTLSGTWGAAAILEAPDLNIEGHTVELYDTLDLSGVVEDITLYVFQYGTNDLLKFLGKTTDLFSDESVDDAPLEVTSNVIVGITNNFLEIKTRFEKVFVEHEDFDTYFATLTDAFNAFKGGVFVANDIENIVGAAGKTTIKMQGEAVIQGTVTAGKGDLILDYSNYNTPVIAKLSNHTFTLMEEVILPGTNIKIPKSELTFGQATGILGNRLFGLDTLFADFADKVEQVAVSGLKGVVGNDVVGTNDAGEQFRSDIVGGLDAETFSIDPTNGGATEGNEGDDSVLFVNSDDSVYLQMNGVGEATAWQLALAFEGGGTLTPVLDGEVLTFDLSSAAAGVFAVAIDGVNQDSSAVFFGGAGSETIAQRIKQVIEAMSDGNGNYRVTAPSFTDGRLSLRVHNSAGVAVTNGILLKTQGLNILAGDNSIVGSGFGLYTQPDTSALPENVLTNIGRYGGSGHNDLFNLSSQDSVFIPVQAVANTVLYGSGGVVTLDFSAIEGLTSVVNADLGSGKLIKYIIGGDTHSVLIVGKSVELLLPSTVSASLIANSDAIPDGSGSTITAETSGSKAGLTPLDRASAGVVWAEAQSRWVAAGADRNVVNALAYSIADLAESRLGRSSSDGSIVDTNAAGHGWHIDYAEEVVADSIDLLSVMMHEIGHALGLSDSDSGVMRDVLALGTRNQLSDEDKSQASSLPVSNVFSHRVDEGLLALEGWTPKLGAQLRDYLKEFEVPLLGLDATIIFGDGLSSLFDGSGLIEKVEAIRGGISGYFADPANGAGDFSGLIAALQPLAASQKITISRNATGDGTDLRAKITLADFALDSSSLSGDEMSFEIELPGLGKQQVNIPIGLDFGAVDSGFGIDGGIDLDFAFGLDSEGEFYVGEIGLDGRLEVGGGFNPVSTIATIGDATADPQELAEIVVRPNLGVVFGAGDLIQWSDAGLNSGFYSISTAEDLGEGAFKLTLDRAIEDNVVSSFGFIQKTFDFELSLGPVGLSATGAVLAMDAGFSLGTKGHMDLLDLRSDDASQLLRSPSPSASAGYNIVLPIETSAFLGSKTGLIAASSDGLATGAGLAGLLAGIPSSIEMAGMDDLLSGMTLSLDTLLEGLQEVLGGIKDSKVYTASIPGVDLSIKQLLTVKNQDLIGGLHEGVGKLRGTLNNIGDVEQALNNKASEILGFDIQPFEVSYLQSVLDVDFKLEHFLEKTLPFSLDFESINDLAPRSLGNIQQFIEDAGGLSFDIEGNADIKATAYAGLDFGFGLDASSLFDPFFYLDNHSGFSAGLGLQNESPLNLALTAEIGLAGAKIPLTIATKDGSLKLNLDGFIGFSGEGLGETIRLTGSEDVPELSDLFVSRFTGSGMLDLPLYFPLESMPISGFAGDFNNDGIDDHHLNVAIDVGGSNGLSYKVVAPEFGNVFGIAAFLNDPEFVLLGLEGMFGVLKESVDGKFLNLELPFVGEALKPAANFIDDLRDELLGEKDESGKYASGGLGQELQNAAEDGKSVIELVQEGLYNTLGKIEVAGITLLQRADTDALGRYQFDTRGRLSTQNVNGPEDILLTFTPDRGLTFNVVLAGNAFSESVPIDFELGIPGLEIKTGENDTIDVSLDYALGLGFGFDKNGFFMDTSGVYPDGSELVIDLTAALSEGAALNGRLGILQASLQDIGSAGIDVNDDGTIDFRDFDGASRFTGLFSFDLQDGAEKTEAGRWHIGETLSAVATLTASANADIYAELKLGSVSLKDLGLGDGVLELPGVFTAVHYDQVFANAVLGGGESGGFTGPQDPEIWLESLSVDAGQFLTGTLGPLMAPILEYTKPLRPFIDLLSQEIGFLKEIDAPFKTIGDILKAVNPDPKIGIAIDLLINLNRLLTIADEFAEEGFVNFGDYILAGAAVANSPPPPVSGGSGTSSSGNRPVGSKTSEKGDKLNAQLSVGAEDSGTFTIPMLTDPFKLLDLMSGKIVDLFTYEFPEFAVKGKIEKTVPIFPGLSARLTFEMGASMDLTVGYDSRGLINFAGPNFDGWDTNDPVRLFDGFYIEDFDVNGNGQMIDKDGVIVTEDFLRNDRDEVTLSAEVKAAALVGVQGLVEAGVEGGVKGTLGFDLNDFTSGYNEFSGDGKLYGEELVSRVSDDILCLFDIEGTLRAYLDAFIWVGIDASPFGKATLYEHRENFVDEILASFTYSCPPAATPDIAADPVAGELRLVMSGDTGENADGSASTLMDYSLDIQETLDLTELFNYASEGAGAGDLDANGVNGANRLIKDKNGRSLIDSQGNPLEDQIVLRSRGVVEVFDRTSIHRLTVENGSAENDKFTVSAELVAHLDSILINSGAGDDIISLGGGQGILGADKTIVINAGEGDDIVIGSAYADTISGGKGNDLIDAAGGNDIIYGVSLGDILNEGGPLSGDRIIGGDGADTIVGGDGADFIYGDLPDLDKEADGVAYADIIHAGAGNDIVLAGFGADSVYGEAGYDVIAGEDGDDIILSGGSGRDQIDGGAGNDTLDGGDELDILLGRSGQDVLRGGKNNDVLRGGTGSDQLYGDDGDDAIFWEYGDGNDSVDGGAGKDGINLTGWKTFEGVASASNYISDAGLVDDVRVSAASDNKGKITWSNAEVNETLEVDNLERVHIDTGLAADSIRIGTLLNTKINAVAVSGGLKQTLATEENPIFDGDGMVVVDENGVKVLAPFFVANTELDGSRDVITIVGGAQDDHYIASSAPSEIDPTQHKIRFEQIAPDGKSTIIDIFDLERDDLVEWRGLGDSDTIDASAIIDSIVDEMHFYGGDGDDTIIGSNLVKTSDLLVGGFGSDRITGGVGVDRFLETEGSIENISSDIDALVESRNADFQLNDSTLIISDINVPVDFKDRNRYAADVPRYGSETEALNDLFEHVDLTGGLDINLFNFVGWSASGLVDGGESTDIYTLQLSSSTVGQQYFSIVDSGKEGEDELRYIGSDEADLIQLDTVYQAAADPLREFTEDRYYLSPEEQTRRKLSLAHGDGLIISHYGADAGEFAAKGLDDEAALLAVNERKLSAGQNFQVVNYGQRVIEKVTLFTGEGDDKLISDGMAAKFNIYMQGGDDQIYIGSILSTEEVIADGQIITIVNEVTHGADFEDTRYFGGEGDDYFEVAHNAADIRLFGDNGDDTFFIRALLTINDDGDLVEKDALSALVSGVLGADSELGGGAETDTREVDIDTIVYVENANVSIDGGAGFDSLAVVGTALADTFYVYVDIETDDQGKETTVQRIYGAGIKLREVLNIERYQLITGAGDDQIFVYGTDFGVVGDFLISTGSGSDTVQFGGTDVPFTLNFPKSFSQKFVQVNKYDGDNELVNADVPIFSRVATPASIPFVVDNPARSEEEDMRASQRLSAYRNPILVDGGSGLHDTVIVDNRLGAEATTFSDEVLVKRQLSLDFSKVNFSLGQEDAFVQVVSDSGVEGVNETIQGEVTNYIRYIDRYYQPGLIDLISQLSAEETFTLDIPAGIPYLTLQAELDEAQNLVSPIKQLKDLEIEGLLVETELNESDISSENGIYEKLVKLLYKDNDLAVKQQLEEKITYINGEEHIDYNTQAFSLNTSAMFSITFGAGAVTEHSELRSDRFSALGISGDSPIIYIEGVDEITVKTRAEGATTTISNGLYTGELVLDHGDASDTIKVEEVVGLTRILGNGGDDTVLVGQGANTQAIGGKLIVRGGEGNDTVDIDNSVDNSLENYLLSQEILRTTESSIENSRLSNFSALSQFGDESTSDTQITAAENAAVLAALKEFGYDNAADILNFDKAAVDAVVKHIVDALAGSFSSYATELKTVYDGSDAKRLASLNQAVKDSGLAEVRNLMAYYLRASALSDGSALSTLLSKMDDLGIKFVESYSYTYDEFVDEVKDDKGKVVSAATKKTNTKTENSANVLLPSAKISDYRSSIDGLDDDDASKALFMDVKDHGFDEKDVQDRFLADRKTGIANVKSMLTKEFLDDSLAGIRAHLGKDLNSVAVSSFTNTSSRTESDVDLTVTETYRLNIVYDQKFKTELINLTKLHDEIRQEWSISEGDIKTVRDEILAFGFSIDEVETIFDSNKAFDSVLGFQKSLSNDWLKGSSSDTLIPVEHILTENGVQRDLISAEQETRVVANKRDSLNTELDRFESILTLASGLADEDLDTSALVAKAQSTLADLAMGLDSGVLSDSLEYSNLVADIASHLNGGELDEITDLLSYFEAINDEVVALREKFTSSIQSMVEGEAPADRYNSLAEIRRDPDFISLLELLNKVKVWGQTYDTLVAEGSISLAPLTGEAGNAFVKIEKALASDRQFEQYDAALVDFDLIEFMDRFVQAQEAAFNIFVDKEGDTESLSSKAHEIARLSVELSQIEGNVVELERLNKVNLAGLEPLVQKLYNELYQVSNFWFNGEKLVAKYFEIYGKDTDFSDDTLVPAIIDDGDEVELLKHIEMADLSPRWLGSFIGSESRLIDSVNTLHSSRNAANDLQTLLSTELRKKTEMSATLTDAEAQVESENEKYTVLKQQLTEQLRVIRGLSDVIVEVLSESRKGRASEGFGLDGILVARLTALNKSVDVLPWNSDQAPIKDAGFKKGASTGSVEVHKREVSYQHVLSVYGGLGAGGSIHVDQHDVENLMLHTGTDDDAVAVQATLASDGSVVSVHTGAGEDKITVSSAEQTLDRIHAALKVDAGSGRNQLSVDDRLVSTGDSNIRQEFDAVMPFVKLSGIAKGDIIYGATGGDYAEGISVHGGKGADKFVIGATYELSPTQFHLGEGDDSLKLLGFSRPNQSTLQFGGEQGDDLLDLRDSLFTAESFGNEGDDILLGGAGSDRLHGNDGNDILFGGGATDTLSGNAGDDIIIGDFGSVVRGGRIILPYVGAYVVVGGGGSSDNILGGIGNDVLIGDSGIVTYTGVDTYRTTTIREDLGGNDALLGGEGNDLLLGGGGDDQLFGFDGNDVLTGDGGDVQISNGRLSSVQSRGFSYGGSDLLDGGRGRDVIIGGRGSDVFLDDLRDDIIIGEFARLEFYSDELLRVRKIVTSGDIGGDLITEMLFKQFGVVSIKGELSSYEVLTKNALRQLTILSEQLSAWASQSGESSQDDKQYSQDEFFKVAKSLQSLDTSRFTNSEMSESVKSALQKCIDLGLCSEAVFDDTQGAIAPDDSASANLDVQEMLASNNTASAPAARISHYWDEETHDWKEVASQQFVYDWDTARQH